MDFKEGIRNLMPYMYIHAILIVFVFQDGESQGRICTGLNGAHIGRKVDAQMVKVLYFIESRGTRRY